MGVTGARLVGSGYSYPELDPRRPFTLCGSFVSFTFQHQKGYGLQDHVSGQVVVLLRSSEAVARMQVGTFPGEEEGLFRDVAAVVAEVDLVRRIASHRGELGSGGSSNVDRRRERVQRPAPGTRPG